MPQTSLKQKISLFIAGLIFTLLLLEGVLRLGGWIFDYRLSKRNIVSQTEDEIRILCIGESTTALGGEDSYPSQLEEILNAKNSSYKFKVINAGLVSKTSEDILKKLPQDLKQYQPHFVVSMIGINDYLIAGDEKKPSLKIQKFLRNVRVYNFFKMLSKHLKNKAKQLPEKLGHNDSEDKAEDSVDKTKVLLNAFNSIQKSLKDLSEVEQTVGTKNDFMNIEERKYQLNIQQKELAFGLGIIYRRKKNYPEALRYLNYALTGLKMDSRVFFEIGMIFQEQNQYTKAIKFLTKSVEISPTSRSYLELARVCKRLNEKAVASKFFELAFRSGLASGRAHLEVGSWFEDLKEYPKAEKIYLAGLSKYTGNYFLHEKLALLYEKVGREDKAREYKILAKSKKEMAQRNVSVTERNYNAIVDVVLSNAGVRLIAMQYPLRKIESLKKSIWSKENIIFVENKNNFEKVLKEEDYFEYFSDYFAYDFGHCTRKGNRLIAQNLSNTILELEKDRNK